MGLFLPSWMKKPEAAARLRDQEKIEKAVENGLNMPVRHEAVKLLKNKEMLYRLALDPKEEKQIRADACIRIIDENYFDQKIQMECANLAVKLGIFPVYDREYLKRFFGRITSPDLLAAFDGGSYSGTNTKMIGAYMECIMEMFSRDPEAKEKLIRNTGNMISNLGIQNSVQDVIDLILIPELPDQLKISLINAVLRLDKEINDRNRNIIIDALHGITSPDALLLYESANVSRDIKEIDAAYITKCIEMVGRHPEKLNGFTRAFERINGRAVNHTDFIPHEDKGGFHTDSVNTYHYSSSDCHDDSIPQKKVRNGWHRDGRYGAGHEDRSLDRVNTHAFDRFKPYFEKKEDK